MPANDGTIKIIPAALAFPDRHHVFLGYRKYEVDSRGNLTTPTLVIYKDSGVWKKNSVERSFECEGVTYYFSPDSSPPFIDSRWSEDRVDKFIKRPVLINGEDLYFSIFDIIKKYYSLPSEQYYHLIATWVIGTYFASLFPAYPFLLFFGPKETGKSKVLEILEQLCFNALKVRDLTPAALGDTVEGQQGTILVDQAEKIGDHLVGLLADSYKRGGGKRRIIDTSGGSRTVREFSTYGPKAFAGQKLLDPDLLDRCLRIPCMKAKSATPDFLGEESEWVETRDMLYRFLLHQHDNVRKAFQDIPPIANRRGELWRPLAAILEALRVEEDVIKITRRAFDDAMQETFYRPDDDEIALFVVLLERAKSNDTDFKIRMPDLETILKKQLGGGVVSGFLVAAEDSRQLRKWIGETISKFSLASGQKRIGQRKEREYTFECAHVIDIYHRYIGRDEEG